MTNADKHSKTEQPTAKRKREAKKKGQVARSAEIGGWFSLLIATSALPAVFGAAEHRLLGLTAMSSGVMAAPSVPKAIHVLTTGLGDTLVIALPIALIMAVLAAGSTIAQVGFVLSAKGITPDFSKLNPVKGLKRTFSVRGVWEVAKSMGKLAAIGALAAKDIIGLWHVMVGAQPVAMGPLIHYAGATFIGFIRTISIVGLLLGLADFAFQRWQTKKALMMTKQEVKEESREQQGDPVMKGAIRRKQFTMSRLRMMAEVARADLVVTNPTHYAVALRYDKAKSLAPRVVAKGSEGVAARIRSMATEHGVPIVEDPPLARAVFAACEIDDVIPASLYTAVARLLAFVYTLSPALRQERPVHRRSVSALVA